MAVELSSSKEKVFCSTISGRTLTRNSLWNLAGQGTPLLVAIFAIPRLIEGLGTDRFGVLSLAWMLIGYFSLFDLGLGRALTKLVAEKTGAQQEQEIPALVWTSLFIMLVLGLAGMVVVGTLSPWLVCSVLKIPDHLKRETLSSFRLFALSVPIVISSVALRGILEARQRFDLTNAVRIPMGLFTFLGPLLVLSFSRSLVAIVAALLAARVVAWLVYMFLCLRTMPALRRGIVLRRAVMGPLLRFGGWLTVSNIIGPFMLYLDRFLIASMISISAVTYYVTPYDVITRLWIVPTACMGVMFPAFSATFVRDSGYTAKLYGRAVRIVFALLSPVVIVVILFAKSGLMLWVGPEFAANSFRVAQLLVIGVLMNSIALVSAALVQAVGRPDLTAKLHLVELPLYLAYLWYLVGAFGIIGAALAWLIRVTISAAVLGCLARRVLATSLQPASDAMYDGEKWSAA